MELELEVSSAKVDEKEGKKAFMAKLVVSLFPVTHGFSKTPPVPHGNVVVNMALHISTPVPGPQNCINISPTQSYLLYTRTIHLILQNQVNHALPHIPPRNARSHALNNQRRPQSLSPRPPRIVETPHKNRIRHILRRASERGQLPDQVPRTAASGLSPGVG